MKCHQHKLVSLVGHISMQGSASFFDVLARLSDLTEAPHYPMPLPVVVPTRDQRDQLLRLEPVIRVIELGRAADVTLVGIGRMDESAPLHLDGFISGEELAEMRRLGAVGEVTGWAFDAAGRILDEGTNDRLTSVPREIPPSGWWWGSPREPARFCRSMPRSEGGSSTASSPTRPPPARSSTLGDGSGWLGVRPKWRARLVHRGEAWLVRILAARLANTAPGQDATSDTRFPATPPCKLRNSRIAYGIGAKGVPCQAAVEGHYPRGVCRLRPVLWPSSPWSRDAA